MECIFCKIVAGEIPASFVHRDDDVVAIEDLSPQAPTHLLVIPVQHAANLVDFARAHRDDRLANILRVAAELGNERGKGAFRTVINTGAASGQTVDHLHVHVLAGREMRWPPG